MNFRCSGVQGHRLTTNDIPTRTSFFEGAAPSEAQGGVADQLEEGRDTTARSTDRTEVREEEGGIRAPRTLRAKEAKDCHRLSRSVSNSTCCISSHAERKICCIPCPIHNCKTIDRTRTSRHSSGHSTAAGTSSRKDSVLPTKLEKNLQKCVAIEHSSRLQNRANPPTSPMPSAKSAKLIPKRDKFSNICRGRHNAQERVYLQSRGKDQGSLLPTVCDP